MVNYKTLDMTRLCLRSIRRYTQIPYEMLVIDNNSGDDSLEYLKSLSWIRLVERKDSANGSDSGGYAHAAALDLGLSMCTTEFFMTLHSDTVVHQAGWLSRLLGYFGDDRQTACIGGGKCEFISPWQQWLKKATDFKSLKRILLRTPDPNGMYRYYNRTICSLYRTEILKKEQLSFLMDREKGMTVGKKLYFELVDRGYKTIALPDWVMRQYIWHLAHATQAVNEHEFQIPKRTRQKTKRLIEQVMNSRQMQEIILNDALDI